MNMAKRKIYMFYRKKKGTILMITMSTPIQIPIYKNNKLKNSSSMSFKSDVFELSDKKKKKNEMLDKLIEEMEFTINQLQTKSKFKYPVDYKKYEANEQLKCKGWSFPKGKYFINEEMTYLKSAHNVNNLVPFAIDEEATEYACFLIDNKTNDKVVVIYPFAKTENLYQEKYNNIGEWVKEVI